MTIRNRALCSLALMGAGYFVAFSAWPLHLPSMCIFKRLTGVPCGGCGMTHACCALAQGHVHEALNYHMGVVPLALVVAAACVLLIADAITNRPFLTRAWNKTHGLVVWGGVALYAVFWAINLAKFFHYTEFTL